MKILVNGGKGLIGSAIAEHLRGNHQVTIYDLGMDESVFTSPFDAFIDCARYKHFDEQVQMLHRVTGEINRPGRIILFSSIYGHKAPDFTIYPGTEIAIPPIEYTMLKGGVEQATRYLSKKLRPWEIQMNCIAPGGVCSGHSMAFQDAYRESGGVPMITTRALMPVVDMLLHPDNAVNGQVITVDGGWSL